MRESREQVPLAYRKARGAGLLPDTPVTGRCGQGAKGLKPRVPESARTKLGTTGDLALDLGIQL